MARRTGLIGTIAKMQRANERQHKAQMRTALQAQRAAERAQQAELRAVTQAARAEEQARRAYERAQQADQKERARLYTESRVAHVALLNEQLAQTVAQLEQILAATLDVDDFLDLETLKQQPEIAPFDPGDLEVVEPPPAKEAYKPPPLTGLQALWPGAKAQHAQADAAARQRYLADKAAHAEREAARQQKLAAAQAKYEHEVARIQARVAAQHAEIDQLQQAFAAGVPEAVITYCSLVLEASTYPDDFPQHAKLAYVPESKQLVVEYDLPSFEVIPAIKIYKYVKSRDEITETTRPDTQCKALYASVVAQITLRTLHELFEADRPGHLETIVFNGYVDSIDRGTGQPIRTCLVTVRTSRDTFLAIDLRRIDPSACLQVLNASVSKSPAELVPVRPVLEFSMVDPRFVEEADILSSLDQRPNLMELTPSEFESLITNLFTQMGLETRLTQASRDGGVDCVAYDPRPIFGGKVVIQAKRYKNTVGVSAVRDLFGTVQNEGASKGILVTTSGYGKAAFDFAEGKPLELLSGSHLLYLLEEHAGIQAKIEVPTGWKDLQPDTDG